MKVAWKVKGSVKNFGRSKLLVGVKTRGLIGAGWIWLKAESLTGQIKEPGSFTWSTTSRASAT